MTLVVATERLSPARFVVRVAGSSHAGLERILERELLPLSRRSDIKVTLDLRELDAIDSAALGVLVRVVKRMRPNRADLEVASRHGDDVRRTLELTGLDRLIRVHG